LEKSGGAEEVSSVWLVGVMVSVLMLKLQTVRHYDAEITRWQVSQRPG
jgi:hypothetical protein